MPPAPLPENEEERLASLHRMQLLDTAPEARYDRLTRLARQILDAPFSLLTLVDRDRQWFKSVQGDFESETPRAIAFCAHTILTRQHLVVEDATRDERFQHNPVVTGEPGIRFYAGIPIRNSEGYTIGSFCVADTRARQVRPQELAALHDLAASVESHLRQPPEAPINPPSAADTADSLDPLSRCWTRAALEELARQNAPRSLVVVQLDGYAGVQRTWGEAAARRLLRETIDNLRSALRPGDRLGRLGGDRYLVLSHCPSTHLRDYGRDILERLALARSATPGQLTPTLATLPYGPQGLAEADAAVPSLA